MRSFIKKFKSFIFKRKFLNANVLFHNPVIIDSSCFFEGNNSIGYNTKLNNCRLGIGSYIGRENDLKSVKIGRFCSIGSYIINTTGRHPVTDFVSTHPAFFSKSKPAGFTFSSENIFKEITYSEENYYVVIGNDVWIGDRVTILDGIKIGDGAVIGAGSIVTKNIEPYTVNVGIPARKIKNRFGENQIKYLNNFCWWNKDWDWIKQNSDKFISIEVFKRKYKLDE